MVAAVHRNRSSAAAAALHLPPSVAAAVEAFHLRPSVAAAVEAFRRRLSVVAEEVVAEDTLQPAAVGASPTSDDLLMPLQRQATRSRNCGRPMPASRAHT